MAAPRELLEGVKNVLDAGVSQDDAKHLLYDRGWSAEDVEDVFRELDENKTGEEKEKYYTTKTSTARLNLAVEGLNLAVEESEETETEAVRKEGDREGGEELSVFHTADEAALRIKTSFAAVLHIAALSAGAYALLIIFLFFSDVIPGDLTNTILKAASGDYGLVSAFATLFILVPLFGTLLAWFPASLAVLFSSAEKTTPRAALGRGFAKSFVFFLTFFTSFLLVIGGAALFVVPGIIALACVLFAPTIAVRTSRGPFEATFESSRHVLLNARTVFSHFGFLVFVGALAILLGFGTLLLFGYGETLSGRGGIALLLLALAALGCIVVLFFSFAFSFLSVLRESLEAASRNRHTHSPRLRLIIALLLLIGIFSAVALTILFV